MGGAYCYNPAADGLYELLYLIPASQNPEEAAARARTLEDGIYATWAVVRSQDMPEV